MNRAVFLDRDGVINQKAVEGEYVTRWEEMRILPGVAEAIALLNRAGFRVIVVSNQRCIAKGLITTADLERLHFRMSEVLSSSGATIDAIYYCPHELDTPCQCRKPLPGMLLSASHDHGIDLRASWMIGDSQIDIDAGLNAGCRTVRVGSNEPREDRRASLVAPSLLEASRRILQWEESGRNVDDSADDVEARMHDVRSNHER